MAIYNPKPISWEELRPLRLRVIALAIIVDILLWYLFSPGFSIFPYETETEGSVPLYLINILCFIIDSVFISELILFICDRIRIHAKGEEMNINKTIWYKTVIFFFSILISWILSLIYQVLGWETSDDGLFTTLTCSIIALFIGELYFAYTYTYEIGIAGERMSALQNKIILNNHFELNTLYQLKALLKKDPEKADKMLDSMSDYHKYIVSSTKHATSPVSKEIEFFNAYIQIMKIRYPEGFDIDIDKEVFSIEKKVPIMSFQLIGENVFKHNAIDKDNKILIRIYTEDNGNSISFENNIVPIIGDIPSNKAGIKLIQEYYTGLGLTLKIEKTDNYYKITLPLI